MVLSYPFGPAKYTLGYKQPMKPFKFNQFHYISDINDNFLNPSQEISQERVLFPYVPI